MEFVKVELDNIRSGEATFKEIRAVIDDAGKNGMKYAGYLPCTIGPSGKILSYELIFSLEPDVIEHCYEKVEADNNVLTYAQYYGYKDILNKHEEAGEEFLGIVPVRMGPSGKILEIELVFCK